MARSWAYVDTVAIFLPSLHMPPQAWPSLTAALTILAVCIYTTLLRTSTLRYLRMALSIPGTYFFYDFAWSSSYLRYHNRSTHLGMGTIAVFGTMRLLETCWLRELDGQISRWVHKPSARTTEPPTSGLDGVGDRRHGKTAIMPLPKGARERLLYTWDNLTTVRGISWFAERAWDFAPTADAAWMPSTGQAKGPFIRDSLVSLAIHYLVIDIVDTFNKAQPWDTSHSVPMSSLPWMSRLAASLGLCVTTYVYLTIPYTLQAIICVILGSNPSSWPPMFTSPLAATTLREFWSRWHQIFRRTFGRIAWAGLSVFPSTKLKPLIHKLFIFFLSAFLHLLLWTTLPSVPGIPDRFWDPSTLKFFISQPIGMFLEATVVVPATERLVHDEWTRAAVRRTFAWAFLLWTGCWWGDAWVTKGLYDPFERPVIWTPVRGILHGRWTVEI